MNFLSGFEGNRVWKIIDEHHARPGVIKKLYFTTQRYDIEFDDGGFEEAADPAEFSKKLPPVPSPQ